MSRKIITSLLIGGGTLILLIFLNIPLIISIISVTLLVTLIGVLLTLTGKSTPKQMFQKKLLEGQGKVSRIRSYIFRLQDEKLRKKGEELTENARNLLRLLSKKGEVENAELEIRLTNLFDYMDQGAEALKHYVELQQNHGVSGEKNSEKIEILFNKMNEHFCLYLEKIQHSDEKNLAKEMAILESTMELDQFIENKGRSYQLDDLDRP